jgi:hypothetical protein
MADEGMNILFVPFLTDTKRLHSSTLCASWDNENEIM